MILRCREELISQLQDQIQLFEDDGAQLRDQVRIHSSQNETSEICALQRIIDFVQSIKSQILCLSDQTKPAAA